MVTSPVVLGPENDCAGKAQKQLVREDVPHQETRNCPKVIKIWQRAPDGCLTPRQTGRLTVGSNITSLQASQS
jgi:hypothetical protein